MSSSSKRPHEDALSPSGRSDRSEARSTEKKPKDWRDAFLDDDQPRRRDRSRERDRPRDRYRERDGDRHRRPKDDDRDRRDRRGYSDRYGGGLDYGERSRSRDRAESSKQREREKERDGRGQYPPREQRGGAARGHERESDRHRQTHPDRKDRMKDDEKEEGEIESPPPPSRSEIPKPGSSRGSFGSASGRSPKLSREVVRPDPPLPSGSFKSMNIPTQPRSSAPQTRPIPTVNVLDGDTRQTKKARVDDADDDVSTEAVVVLEEERDPEKVIEERRRKREEIMAKFRANGGKPAAPPAAASATKDTGTETLGGGADSVNSGGTRTGVRTGLTTTGATPLLKALGTRSTLAGSAVSSTPVGIQEPSLANTPLGNDFDLAKQEGSSSTAPPTAKVSEGEELVSAADYDPSAEGVLDQARRNHDQQAMQHVKEVAEGVGEPAPPVVEEDEWEEVEMELEEEDDEMDMFAAFDEGDKPKKKRKVRVRRKKASQNGEQQEIQVIGEAKREKLVPAVVDNVDDAEGYYRITPGEILDDGRYQITITLGKGMFSAVVKAKVLKAVGQERRQDVVGKEVAIKMIRSQESMYVAGRKEAQILQKLNDADPEDKKHIVRMEHMFEHHGHLCIVTESMSMNLRDVLKRFGKDVGLNMRAVRAYAHQMFLALSLMRKCSIVHADIKPDNVLVSENKATLKVCDFGSASDVADGDITPYLVSRFYRAPEIILGLPYDTSIDIWSIGCTLYELYTGKILFPGRSNNHMLLLMMEVKGKLNHRLIKKASFGEMYFDESMNFLSVEKDKITGADVLRTLVISKPSRDIRSRIMPPSSVQLKMKDEEIKQLTSLVDLLDKCLQLDPAKRITPRDALLHPFVSG